MPDTKITALTAIGVVDPASDPLPIVDVSDTSMAASGTTKKISINQILGAGGAGSFSTLAASGAATLSSTLGVTGATTLTGALVANGNVTLGDALADVVTVNGSLTARNGELASSIRAAASDYAGVAFDGATASTRIYSACQAIGTGDFSLWSRFRVPTSFANSPGVLWLSDSNGGTYRANSFGIYLETPGGTLRVFRYGTTPATDNRIATVASFLTNFVGQVVDVVVTRAGNTLKIYINGTDTAYTESTGGAAPAWGQTVVSDFALVGALSSTSIFSGSIYRTAIFNRALSAADVTDLIANGINPADQWGTQTAAYTSDFSAGADGWSGTRSTAVGNVDGISGVDNTLRLTVDSTASSTHYAVNPTVTGLLPGKRYRVGFNYFITAANATMNGLALWQLTSSNQRTTVQSVTGAWTSITPVEFVSTETRLDVLGYAGANSSFTGNGTDTFYLHSFVATRIGAIVDLDFSCGIGYQALDRSTNKLDGTLFNGVSWTLPEFSSTVRGTLTTNAGQQLLGTLAIPTDAHIDYVVVENVSAGSGRTFSLGTASGTLTNIINAQPLGANGTRTTFDPADGFSSTGNLWAAWSAAGTVKVTVAYRQVL